VRERSPIAIVLPIAIALAVIVHGGRWAGHWLDTRHEHQLESARVATWHGLVADLSRTPPLPGLTSCAGVDEDYCWSGQVPAVTLTGAVRARLQAEGVTGVVARCATPKPGVVFCNLRGSYRTIAVACDASPDWTGPLLAAARRPAKIDCWPDLIGSGVPPLPKRWKPVPIPTPAG
jgi:hypothetical protein